MADEGLRDQLDEALRAIPAMRDVLATDVPGGVLDTILAVAEGEALDRMAHRLLEETNLRAMDFRNGMSMEVEPARALAANFVGAARAMLGEAPNYSETPFEMGFRLAGQPERFAFIVQRVAPGKLTPHEARQAAEQRADRYRTAWRSARTRAKEFAQALDEQIALDTPATAREGCVDHTPNPDCEACTR